MNTKVCSCCKRELPMTIEYFNKLETSKDGFMGRCKKCMFEYKKQYREKNREYISAKNKRYYETNKEKIAEQFKQYAKDNKERLTEYYRQYYKKNLPKLLEQKRQYQKDNSKKLYEKKKIYCKNNAEKVTERKRKYMETNMEQFRMRNQKRKAKKKELPSTLTIKQWRETKLYFDNKCAYCGKEKPLAQEHFIPLSKGGEYTANNIIPACKSCNSSKGTKDFFEWYLNYEYYSKEREKKILKFINKGDKHIGK